MGGPHSRSGRGGEEKKPCSFRESNPGNPAHSLVPMCKCTSIVPMIICLVVMGWSVASLVFRQEGRDNCEALTLTIQIHTDPAEKGRNGKGEG
jgi:hypothetical protein